MTWHLQTDLIMNEIGGFKKHIKQMSRLFFGDW